MQCSRVQNYVFVCCFCVVVLNVVASAQTTITCNNCVQSSNFNWGPASGNQSCNDKDCTVGASTCRVTLSDGTQIDVATASYKVVQANYLTCFVTTVDKYDCIQSNQTVKCSDLYRIQMADCSVELCSVQYTLKTCTTTVAGCVQ